MNAEERDEKRILRQAFRRVRLAGVLLVLVGLGVVLEDADAAGRSRRVWRPPGGGAVDPVLADPLDALLAAWISDGEEHGGGAVHAPLPDGSWYEEAVILPPSGGGGGASAPYRRAGALNPYSK